MITYNRSAFGLNLIVRLHGSAVYRAVVPSLMSVAIFFLLRSWIYSDGKTIREVFGDELGHPYAIGAVVASATFLVIFRANQGYARYWEGASATHHMMSKWMDATSHTGVYHMQCDHYKDIKPPSYFDYPELNHYFLTRDRERGGYDTTTAVGCREPAAKETPKMSRIEDTNALMKENGEEETEQRLQQQQSSPSQRHASDSRITSRTVRTNTTAGRDKDLLREEKYKRRQHAVVKSINYVGTSSAHSSTLKRKNHRSASGDPLPPSPQPWNRRSQSADDVLYMDPTTSSGVFEDALQEQVWDTERTPGKGKPFPLWGKPRLDGNWGAFYTHDSATPMATFFHPQPKATGSTSSMSTDQPLPPDGFASIQGGRTPPLFLQELAHLSSLLVAVALSTLRNDIDGAESPLAFYDPGSDWPTVDPDKDQWMKATDSMGRLTRKVWTFLGMGRSPEEQTRYNAGRPLPVLGGVSDGEIRFLQMAKGPYAKTQLCWSWLSEFIIREHLAGTLGDVAPPIISRIIQFLGDGMIYYNHARKIMFIPFPFVHAQLSVLFVVVLIPMVPFLMDQYTEEAWLGAVLTFFTVLCLAGVNEVARELENPFRNVPNELPLVTFQAHYNEALLTMYAGYHPDHYWDGDKVLRRESRRTNTTTSGNQDTRQKDPPKTARGTGEASNRQEEEIQKLKAQLAQQAKLIEQLFQQVGSTKSTNETDDPVALSKKNDDIFNC